METNIQRIVTIGAMLIAFTILLSTAIFMYKKTYNNQNFLFTNVITSSGKNTIQKSDEPTIRKYKGYEIIAMVNRGTANTVNIIFSDNNYEYVLYNLTSKSVMNNNFTRIDLDTSYNFKYSFNKYGDVVSLIFMK